MRKRNSGYILLALLVITGLAGTISGSISKKERKYAAALMKETKTDAINSVKGLSEEQANFKTAAENWSAKECMYHIAIAENNLWQWFETTMAAPPNPEKRAEIKLSDEQVVKMIEDRSTKVKTREAFEPKNTPYQSMDEAMAAFKTKREITIKYIKATTEDLRDRVVQTPVGWIDAYQLYLFIGAHTARHTQQINEIKASSGFPR